MTIKMISQENTAFARAKQSGIAFRYTMAILMIASVALNGCIGTDFMDDPLTTSDPFIEITPTTVAFMVGESAELNAVYVDEFGIEVEDAVFEWMSEDEQIAAVEPSGRVTALMVGQTRVSALSNGINQQALITVVEDRNAVALVTVASERDRLFVGETIQLSAASFTIDDMQLEGQEYMWRSSQPDIVSVDENGRITAHAAGQADIIASTDDIESAPVRITVLTSQRSGTFVTASSFYTVRGEASLSRGSDGALTLQFNDDFLVSNGPRLEVFLSTSERVGSGSVSLGRPQSIQGAQTYTLPSDIAIDTYDFVIIHCVAAGVEFGYAEFQ